MTGTGLFADLPRRDAPTDDAARDRLLDGAIKAGKFGESRRAYYAALYDRDPEGTSALVAKLASGVAITSGPAPSGGTGLFKELR